MSKYKLINDSRTKEDNLGSLVTIEFEADTWPEVLEKLEQFLKASGFNFDGYIDIVSEEDDDLQD